MTYRVTAVCTGNICRSPVAEVVLRARLAEAGLTGVVVDSAGTSDEERGNPVDPRAASVLRAHGYDPADDHRAHRATPAEVGAGDLLLAMTARHARWLRAQAPDAASAARVRLLRSFDPDAPAVEGPDESALDVEDPWYGDLDDFEAVLAQVEAAAEGVVEHVRAALAERAG